MDIARIEAGFVLQGVDYVTSRTCVIDRQKSSPYEAGLGWTVELDRPPFIGQAALAAEAAGVAAYELIGLEVSWPDLERVYGSYKLPPALPAHASRDGQGLFDRGGRQVGYITSSTWSPILKKYIAIGTVESAYAGSGQVLQLEHMVEYRRHRVEASVVERPFFDPPRKRSVPSKGKHG
jgi:aminomethyltransferase